MHIQIIGNYLEKVSELLLKRGIFTESIINGLNPVAMAGNETEKYLHYCKEVGTIPVALNAKKNLKQMLSRDENEFCSNMQLQTPRTEVRYKNTSEYVIVFNSYIAVTLFEDRNSIYSDMWPQNKMTEELKADKTLKRIGFPFPGGMNWKYYYDKFIDAIKSEYDENHIILIRINSARWYMDGESIAAFAPLSKAFKNAIEEIDDYFEMKTGCYTVDALFSQIPGQNSKNAFPYEMQANFSHKMVAEEIYNIITGNPKKEVLPSYHNPFVRYILKRLSYNSINRFKDDLEMLETKWIPSPREFEPGAVSDDIICLRYFLDPESNNCLSDLLKPIEVLTDSQIKEKINIASLYIKYLKVDINDIIAIYRFYCNCPDKSSFKEIASGLLGKGDWGPVKVCGDFVERNLNYLKEYKYISDDLYTANMKKAAYIRIGDDNYIAIDPNSEAPMRQVRIKNEPADYEEILNNDYICNIKQAKSVCANWRVYIEKARKGDGAKPFKILFSSVDEFTESLHFMDYPELLSNERFILAADRNFGIQGACAKTNLDFLFKQNVKICVVANGLADQLAYYVFAEILKQKTNSDIYFYDRTLGPNGREFDKFAKYDVSNRIISNLISEKLLENNKATSWDLANILYENGMTEMTMVLGGWGIAHMDKVKCNKIAIQSIPSFFTIEFNSLSYYWCLIRPDEIMEYAQFKLSDYICFPDFDTRENIEIYQKMLKSDSVAIHVRRGDFVTAGRADDLSFYFNSVKEILNISQYTNRKWFIFSDDISFCKSHTSELGFDQIKNEEIIFIDHNKYKDSFRDMQLMTYSKVIVGGNSGFSRIAAIYSDRCEVFIYNAKHVMTLHERIGRKNKYDISAFVDREDGNKISSKEYVSNTVNPVLHDTDRSAAAGTQNPASSSVQNLYVIRQINRIASIGGSVFDYFIDRGIDKINLFGNDELTALLYEQALLKGLQVNKCFSDKSLEYNINLLDKHLKVGDKDTVASRKINTVDMTYDDGGMPTVLLEKTTNSFSHKYTIEALLNYSSLMQRLFRTVFEYKKQYAPNLKIIVVQFPSLRNVQNKNKYEESLLQSTSTINPFKEMGYDDEYIKDVNWLFPEYYKGEVPMLVDHESKYLNIIEGHRVTVDIPETAKRTIFTFGPSVIFGYRTDDEHTVSSSLQRELNRYYGQQSPYQVLNCAFAGGQNYIAMRRSFLAHKPQNGDVAIFFHWPDMSLIKDTFGDEFYYFDPQKDLHLFDRPHKFGEYIFADNTHLMPTGNDLLGKTVAKELIESNVLNDEMDNADFNELTNIKVANDDNMLSEQLDEYLESIEKSKSVIGAIVMNCNPFTFGHRYLIEYASKKCDRLYIFAVEEDLSYFPFGDRIELIRKGVSDLKNVTVLPSGKFMISRTTFPAYFEKEGATDDTVIDASSDIEIFAKQIAPRLNISVRFAGEEPLDNVTRQYNAQMKMILPRHGIDFEVIPRKEIDGEVVSASRVRRLLKEKNFAEIEKIVPPTTLEYLKNKFGK